jgi:glycosyltransferase involved in cell wall biosynthesis
MSLRLFSQVNADSDLIEAWLKYYLRLGVDWFHLVVHGSPEENDKLLAIKDSYPITIEDIYQGPFPAPTIRGNKLNSTEKKDRLDALLARYTGQWVLLVDSDEFVEFPYQDIPETIRKLESANANVMAAPLLQRLKTDGSLDSPPVIDDPFQIFPLCSLDLYRRMGVSADIFKFPLFYCVNGTELVDEGNHYPPQGLERKASEIRGVSHHFKFRRIVTQRLEKRINSTHPWRFESLGFQEYLNHSSGLPLEEAFPYSREELFRRGLLRALPLSKPACQKACDRSVDKSRENVLVGRQSEIEGAARENEKSQTLSSAAGKRIMFVLPKAAEFGGREKHLLDLVRRLKEPRLHPLIVCFEHDLISAQIDDDLRAQVVVKCQKEAKSLWDWFRLIRETHPAIIVFLYSSVETFPWKAPAAALLAGVGRRFSIHQLVAQPPPPPIRGWSPRNMVRRLIGKRTRYLLGVAISAYVSDMNICVSNAVRDVLVNAYRFPSRKTITIHNGASTSTFFPSKKGGAALRERLGIVPEDFLLVCVARLVEAKGIDILLHAVSRVVRQGVSCKCVILGDGPLKEKLLHQMNSLGLWNYVCLEGFQKDVLPYLQAASAFILTSHREGLPLSVVEAMACGVPCIVTNVGGGAELVKDQVVGLVIPPASVEAAADAILYLATHPRERAEMAGRTRESVCRSFDIEDKMGELRRVILS